MKSLLIIIFFLIPCKFLFCQEKENQIEVSSFFLCNQYPKFSYSINPVNSFKVKITGTGPGIYAAYNFYIKKNIYIKPGIGYYKYAFNNITQTNSQFGNSNNRVVEDYSPPGGITPGLIYTTNKYFYNTVFLLLGIEKHSNINNNIQLSIGVTTKNYFTFSQFYHITYPSPVGDNYKQNSKRYFGFSANIYTSIMKKIKRFNVGPKLVLSIYDSWKKDKIFPQEENNQSRCKWLNGVGIGINISYRILKHNQNEK